MWNLADIGDQEATHSLQLMRSLSRVETFTGKTVNHKFDQQESVDRRISLFGEFVKSSGTEFAGKVSPVFEMFVDPNNDYQTTASIILMPCSEDVTAGEVIGAAAKFEDYIQSSVTQDIKFE